MQLERERHLAAQARRLLDAAESERQELQRRADARAAADAAERARVERTCSELGALLTGERGRSALLEGELAREREAARLAEEVAGAERRQWLISGAAAAAADKDGSWRLDLALRELGRVEGDYRRALLMAQEELGATANGAAEVVSLRLKVAFLGFTLARLE